MVKFYDSVSPDLAEWAMAQAVFFVASAPLAGKHVNLSPKGLPSSSFSVLGPNQCAYVDATGSGSETISHVYENGRVTIMFCSFDASPRIMRFFCTGEVVEWDQPRFPELLEAMGRKRVEGARAVILLQVWKCQTSCGFGVPRLAKVKAAGGEGKGENGVWGDAKGGDGLDQWVAGFEDRETMGHWASKKVEKNELHKYQAEWNSNSLDGLTGLRAAMKDQGEKLLLAEFQAWMRRMWGQREAVAVGFTLSSIIFFIWSLAQAFFLK